MNLGKQRIIGRKPYDAIECDKLDLYNYGVKLSHYLGVRHEYSSLFSFCRDLEDSSLAARICPLWKNQ